MSRAYSLDLRQRAVALVAAGQSRRAVARLLDLGDSTVIRWTRRQADTGSPAAKPRGGARRIALVHERDWVLARMAAAPDLTVRALRAELAARGTVVCLGAVWRFLQKEGLAFNKKPARRRADAAGRRPQA